MKKIISSLIALAIAVQSVTVLAVSDGGAVETVATESAGTELISSGDFSSDISSKFSVQNGAQTIVYESGANNDGNPFLHIHGTRDTVNRYLQYNAGLTLQPGTYVFSFDVRHGYDNSNLPGDFTNALSYNSYREFKVKMDLKTGNSTSIGESALQEIFGGDLYETCIGPVAYNHPETHKLDPAGYMVFDEGTKYGLYHCLTPRKDYARIGSEWRTVTKTFVIDEQMTLQTVQIYGGDNKTTNMLSYDIDNLSLKYYGATGSIPAVPGYDLDPVDGVTIKKGTANIDGELDAAYLSSLNINMFSANASEWAKNWNSTARARTYYMYDDSYIYLFASVMDDDVVVLDLNELKSGNVMYYANGTGRSPILNNDLFVWRLSLDGTPNTLKIAVDANGYRVFGVENSSGAIMTGTTTADTVYTKNDYSKIQKATKLTDFGYQIEVRVPRQLDKVNSKSATKLGVALELRDLAASGSIGYECLAKAGEAYNFPVFFNLSSQTASGAGYLYGTDLSGTCGNEVSWEISDDGVLTIAGFGAIPNYDSVNSVPWMMFMGQIGEIIVEPGITAIGDYAFEGASNLASVEIPDSVIYIGKNSFKDNSSLSSIAFGGVKDEWDAIPKLSGWNSGAGNYTVTYGTENSAAATEGSCGTGLTWSLANGTLSINGTGAMYDFTAGGAPWHDYAALINNIVIANGVTKIGDYAFANCSYVENITVPASVTSIGNYAFAGCTNLESINLSEGLATIGESAFANCAALTAVTIPASVTAIGDGAFSGCDALASIAVNAGNTSYTSENGVLYSGNMATLIHYPARKTDTAFTVPSGVTAIAGNAFKGAVNLESVVISGTVTAIGEGAFSGCTALTSAEISGAVTAIADDAFAYCVNLASVTLPASVRTIGNNAFTNCYNLESIDLSNVTTIGEKAFFSCGLPADYKDRTVEDFIFGTGLTSVTLSGNLTSIGKQAFANCNNLSDIYFGADRATWNSVSKGVLWDADVNYTLHIAGAVSGSCGISVNWEVSGNILTISGLGDMTDYSAGAGSAYYDDKNSGKCDDTADIANWTPWYEYKDVITTVVIEPEVTSIGDNAFKGYTALTSVTIPDSVISIGEYAFNGCTSLTTVNGMNCIETLGDGAFKGCSALTSITIPETLAVISYDAFNSCTSLTTLNLNVGLTDIEAYAFWGCSKLTSLVLPEGTVNIGDYAFYSCKGITTVNIPISTRHIGDYAFTNCADLATVNYAGTPARWLTVADGLLWSYRAGRDTANGTYTLVTAEPDYVDYGMCGRDVVWTLDANGTLTIMGEGAMIDFTEATGAHLSEYADEITAIVIEKGIKHIGSYAVASNLPNVANIHYTGDDEDWAAVTKATNWDHSTGSATASGKYVLSTYQLEVIASGTCGATGADVKWVLTEDYTLTISGTGAMEAYSATSNAPWYEYCEAIKTVVIESGVNEIKAYAFHGCINMTDISIASTVKTIASDSFVGCVKLKEIDIPASVTDFGKSPFLSVDNLESINVASDNEKFISQDGVLFNKEMNELVRFPSGKNVASYVIPEGVTTIAENAFLACTKLTSVTLPSTLTKISNYAFQTCYSLTGITIPASVTSVGSGVFLGCNALEAITVDTANTTYAAVDGVLYTKDMSTLHTYPVGKAGTAFTIPNGVTTIGNYAFGSHKKLTTVSIPNSVTKINAFAFQNCTALAEIKYAGSEDQWSNVSFGRKWNENTGKYTVKYELASGKCGENLEWGITANGTLTISGTGAMIEFASADKAPWYAHRDIIKTVEIKSGVTSIADNAFTGYDITSITVPASVTAIGDTALRDCDSLTAITVDAANIAYATANDVLFTKDMKTLVKYPAGKTDAEYSIPADVATVGAYAFEGNANLTVVNIPVSVTAIGDYAFADCSKVATINYASVDKDWGKITKGDNWDTGTGSQTEGGKYTLVTVPNTDITEGTLGENLEWFITAEGVFTISGAGAIGSFENATTPWDEYRDVIKAVVIGDGVTSIGDFVFTNHKAIESVTLGADVTAIGKHAFFGCDNLASIDVDAANASFASDDGVLYSDDMTSLILYPAGKADTTFSVPAGVTTIISYAVRSAKNLTAVIIPDSVTTIGNYAFWGSSNIETVTIGSGVAAIGSWAFAYGDSLTAIEVSEDNANYTSVDGVLYTKDMKTLVSYPIGKTATTFAVPEGVKRISNYAFYGCDSLVTITLPASVTIVGNNVFNYCDSLTAVNVAEDNTRYASVNGVLYNKEMTTLVYYPAGKTADAFTVPETVTSIGKSAFEDCDNLVTVNVGTNVTKVGYAAFAYCDKLVNINYAGTEAEWDEVVKGNYWNRYLDGDEVKFGA